MNFLLFLLATSSSILNASAFIPTVRRAALKAQLRNACKEKDERRILKIADELAQINPTTDIVRDFGKLDGQWKLDFTTAPTSEVPRDESSGFKTFQSIDTKTGIIYNVIDRGLPEKGLKIGVGAEPTRKNRVALDFRTIEAYNTSFPRKVTLRFPPRQFFKLLRKAVAPFTGKPFDELEFKEIAHFDVLFVDDDLRIQKNSEGNIFVNSRM